MAGSIDVESPTLKVINKRLQKANTRQLVRESLVRLIVLVAALVALFTFVFGFYVVPDNGMDPSLKEGDVVLFYRLATDYQSEDVVVYEKDGEQHAGRIVAMPTEEVSISQDGTFTVNGGLETPKYGGHITPAENGIEYPCLNGMSSYFVLGDNYERAWDSRTCGPIDMSEMSGKVITILRKRNI